MMINAFFLSILFIFTQVLAKNLKERKLNSNFDVNFPECSSNDNCGHGTCNTSSKRCECDKGYVTYIDYDKYTPTDGVINLESDFKMCNYHLRKQLTALMISIFVGFGSEHFYLGNYSPAAGKFIFYIFCYYLNIGILLFYFLCKKKRNLLKFIGIFEGIYMGMGFGFMMCWNLYDWIKIGLNQMPDSKGFKMYSWNSGDN